MLRMLTALGATLRRTRLLGGRAMTVALCAVSLSLAVPYRSGAYSSQAYDRGVAEMGRGDWDGAILSFGEVIGFDMNNLDAYISGANVFIISTITTKRSAISAMSSITSLTMSMPFSGVERLTPR